MPKNKTKQKSAYNNKVKARKNAGDDHRRNGGKMNHKKIWHEGLRAVYNKDKTWLQNMKELDVVEVFEPQMPEQSEIDKLRHKPKVNEDEVVVLKALHKKYCARSGDAQDNTAEAAKAWDFRKMARDTKINQWQWTEAKVEKLMVGHFIECDIVQRSLEAENRSGHAFKEDRWIDENGRKRNIFGH